MADRQPSAVEKSAEFILHQLGRSKIGAMIGDQHFFAVLMVVFV